MTKKIKSRGSIYLGVEVERGGGSILCSSTCVGNELGDFKIFVTVEPDFQKGFSFF